MRTSSCLLLGLALMGIGCGGGSGGVKTLSEESKAKLALEEVGELYRIYTVTNGKAPERIDDLKSLGNVGPTAIKAIKAGEIVVRYGATMTETEEGAARARSDEVLAYEKKVPESGGETLMLDRTVRAMTADEFKAAKKAGKG